MLKSARIGTWSLALLLLFLSAGCGSNSFVGQRFNNFTAYYNTFYNARQAYDTGVRSIEQTSDPIDRQHYLSIFGGPPRSGGNVTFQDAIDKSADLLRGHPTSKWVDDALVLIGKSYFYQENFVGAEQKFREAIDLETGLEDEARIWLARTLIAAGAYDEARDHLLISLEQEDVSRRWAPRLHLAMGELNVRRGAFEEAATELETGLQDVRDGELEAKAWFLLGQVYETLGRHEDAVTAYGRTRSTHPRYELSYAAELSAARVQGMHLDAETALDRLRRMERDDKNYTNRFEIAYTRGRIYQAQERAHEARAIYRGILYDREGQITDLRGRIHYALGELYEVALNDYLIAAAHYDTARTSLTTSSPSTSGSAEITPQAAPEAITDAADKAAVFASFSTARLEIARMDSLLELGLLNDEEFADRILEIRRQRAEEFAEQQRRAEELQARQGFQNAASRAMNRDGPVTTGATGGAEAGFLYHRDPVRVQEAQMNFIARWGERPHVPNWRRAEAVAAATADTGDVPQAAAVGETEGDAQAEAYSLPPVDYSDVPRDSASRVEVREQRALARYELGNVLFLSMNRPDSAAAWYRMVIDQDTEEEVAQRAFYALAEVQRSIGDSVAASRLYEQVLREFPESDFAGRVREQLGMEQITSSDSLAMAQRAYDEAYAQWNRGRYRDALEQMLETAAKHSSSEVAPKALLAAGRIYMEWADSDSMDVFGPVPVSVSLPDSLFGSKGLPGSPPGAERTETDTTAGPVGRLAADSMASTGEQGQAAPRLGPDDSVRPDGDAADGVTAASREVPARDTGAAAGGGRTDSQGEIEGAPASADTAGSGRDSGLEELRRVLGERAADAERTGADTVSGDEVARLRIPARDTSAVNRPGDTNGALSPSVSADTLADGGRPGSDTGSVNAVDVTEVARDSLAGDSVPPGEAMTMGGLAAAPGDDALYLASLYASVRDRYPSTPYAQQAGAMLNALEQRHQEMHAAAGIDSSAAATEAGLTDATRAGLIDPVAAALAGPVAAALAGPVAAALADSLAGNGAGAPAGHHADTLSAEQADTALVRDGRPASAETADAPAIPSGEESLRGDGGIEHELGGFTLVLGMNVTREPMDVLVQKYAEQGYRADIVTEQVGSTTLYRAAIGHFPTAAAASAAADRLVETIDETMQVAPLKRR